VDLFYKAISSKISNLTFGGSLNLFFIKDFILFLCRFTFSNDRSVNS